MPLPWVDLGTIASGPWFAEQDPGGPSALYLMDEASGGIVDYSGNNRHGNPIGTLQYRAGGSINPMGGAASHLFSGDDRIDLPSFASTIPASSWSISVMHYPTRTDTTSWLIGTNAALCMSWGAMGGAMPDTGPGRAAIAYVQNSQWYLCSDPTARGVNTWNHHVGTWNGSTLRMYHNGVDVRSNTTNVMPPALGNEAPQIAARLAGYNYYGYIDDFRIYPVCLSAEQVAALWKRLTGVRPGPWMALGKVT